MNASNLKRSLLASALGPMLLLAGCQTKSLVPIPALATYTLSVTTSGAVPGVAIAVSFPDNAGASNGTDSFTRTYNAGTSVVLTAPATSGTNLFKAWTGCTSTTTVACTVTLTANTTVTATYAPPPNYVLTVGSTNPAAGVPIAAAPADNSGAGNGTTNFTRNYVSGTSVTLTAPATASGNNFSSWTGCSAVTANICTVALTGSRTVTANYVTPSVFYGLTVQSTNPTSGVSIAAAPADRNGLSTGTTGYTLSYLAGTSVTLTAPAASGSQVFQSWSGCAAVNGLACTVAMNAAVTVTANYYVAATGRTYYVSPSGSDTNNGFSTSSAFLTLQKAADTTAPGDVVYVMSGTYTGSTPTSTVMTIRTPGTASAPIAYRAYPGQTPTINFSSFNAIYLSSTAAYIEVNGFTVNGNNQNVTYAQASTADAIANPGNYPQFNGNCIVSDNRSASATVKTHHINILNNIVGNCGAGIAMNETDYVTISGNTVFNCAWYDAYGTSGISMLADWNSDSNTGYKMFITNNRIYNNYELIPYHVTSPLTITDGEGIIIDTNQNSAVDSSLTIPPYTGRTLIANNVIYSNGSSGIEVFQSSHVDVVNNSTYGNFHTPATTAYATPTGRGELNLNRAADVNVYNNILYSLPTQNPVVQGTCTNCTSDYNVFYNGANVGFLSGANDITSNPLYVNATASDFTKVDLSLIPGSPAIDTGTSNLAPAVDFLNSARPKGKGFDRGAYEQ